MISNKKRGLGRGLSDLGLNELLSRISDPQNDNADHSAGELRLVKIEKIVPGKYQPRRVFGGEALQELADSIRSQGIIQPIIVRKTKEDGYEIIAGERRWRAAKLADLTEVPVVIRDIPNEAAVAVALIENIQRENLNAIEEASALHRLGEEFSLTHQEIAKLVGKSRTTITNLLRLLSLDPDVKVLVEKGQLEMGHARALLALSHTQQNQAATAIVTKKMTVRDAESYIRKLQNLNEHSKNRKPKNLTVVGMEKTLSKKLGSRVSIKHQENGKGKLIVHYRTLDQLKDLVDLF